MDPWQPTELARTVRAFVRAAACVNVAVLAAGLYLTDVLSEPRDAQGRLRTFTESYYSNRALHVAVYGSAALVTALAFLAADSLARPRGDAVAASVRGLVLVYALSAVAVFGTDGPDAAHVAATVAHVGATLAIHAVFAAYYVDDLAHRCAAALAAGLALLAGVLYAGSGDAPDAERDASAAAEYLLLCALALCNAYLLWLAAAPRGARAAPYLAEPCI
jgi:hypothetical protein